MNRTLPIVIYSENNSDYVIYGASSSIDQSNEAFTFYPITKITFNDVDHTYISTSALKLKTITDYENLNSVTVNVKFDKVIILNLIQTYCIFDD